MGSDSFVCFSCRFTWSRLLPEQSPEWDPATRNWVRQGRRKRPASPCPKCRAEGHFTGPTYRPPRREDAKAWRIDATLAAHGLLAYSPRCARGVSTSLQIDSEKKLTALLRSLGKP
jgi:hypothetical protein